MGECWSCGAHVGGLHYMFTCPACAETALMKDIKDGVNSQEKAMQMIASGFNNVVDKISDISDELFNLAGIVQGGFDELQWEMQQQTNVLISIDKTLKTPSQTQAKEWREMAEQLRKRGCLDEAEKWFLKSLETSPLDFRTYIGLAFNYLRKNDFDKAEDILTKSFPHAPKGNLRIIPKTIDEDLDDLDKMVREQNGADFENEFDEEYENEGHLQVLCFDYKSLSHRLIGRIYACKEEYDRAANELKLAINLSPDYTEGNYDYALYCIQSGKKEEWKEPLCHTISNQPRYLNVALLERRFAPIRQDLDEFLYSLLKKERNKAIQSIQDAEIKFSEFKVAVNNSPFINNYSNQINEIAKLLNTYKTESSTNDYSVIINMPENANRVSKKCLILTQEVKDSLIAFSERKEKRQWEIFKLIIKSIVLSIILAIVLEIPGCVIGFVADICTSQKKDYYLEWGCILGFCLGIVLGISWGIFIYKNDLKE